MLKGIAVIVIVLGSLIGAFALTMRCSVDSTESTEIAVDGTREARLWARQFRCPDYTGPLDPDWICGTPTPDPYADIRSGNDDSRLSQARRYNATREANNQAVRQQMTQTAEDKRDDLDSIQATALKAAEDYGRAIWTATAESRSR